MNLQDAMFNWLQMHIVSEARPEDRAARDTLDFFATILREDHNLGRFEITAVDEENIIVQYELEDGEQTKAFDRELCEKLLADINSNPKIQ